MAELRVAPGRDNEHAGAAAYHGTPHEHRVGDLPQLLPSGGEVPGPLLDRVRLSSEQRLVDEKVVGFEQTRVGRHEVASGQADYISGDQVLGWQVQLPAVAHTAHAERHSFLQRFDGPLRAVFLEEV